MLMILNVAVYLWASSRQTEAVEVEIQASPDVNKEGMLLLSETGGSRAVEVAASLAAGGSGGSDSQQRAADGTLGLGSGDNLIITEDLIEENSKAGDLTQTVSVIPPASGKPGCYRIGPFKKPDSWQAAQDWLTEQAIAFKPVTSESRELLAVRVYLGPFASGSAIDASVSLLKEKNLDYFVYQVDNGASLVSLGYFTQQELATKFLSYLSSINVNANSQPEYRKLGPFNWMEIPAESAGLDLLQRHDWLENDVGLSQLDC